MATYILNPIGNPARGDWTPSGNVVNAPNIGAQVVENLKDATDGSIASTPIAGSSAYLELTFADLPALPAGAQIRSVTPRVRVSSDRSYGKINWQLWNHVFGVVLPADSFGDLTTNWVTVTGLARTREYSGWVWSEAIVNNTGLLVARPKGGYPSLRITKAEILVVANERPVVTATGPVDEDAGVAGNQVTTTSPPTVSWLYSDPENDAQERFQVKVFSAAQYGAAGFNPDTSAATWDSGAVYSSATSIQVGTILANNTTYRAYVKASDVGSDGRPSLWSFFEFTMALPSPPIPAFSVPVADVANQ